jgi:hypothetical protein
LVSSSPGQHWEAFLSIEPQLEQHLHVLFSLSIQQWQIMGWVFPSINELKLFNHIPFGSIVSICLSLQHSNNTVPSNFFKSSEFFDFFVFPNDAMLCVVLALLSIVKLVSC